MSDPQENNGLGPNTEVSSIDAQPSNNPNDSPPNPFARFRGMGTWDLNDHRYKARPIKDYLPNMVLSNTSSSKRRKGTADESDDATTPRPVKVPRGKTSSSASHSANPKASSTARKPRGKATSGNAAIASSSQATKKRVRIQLDQAEKPGEESEERGDTSGNPLYISNNTKSSVSRKRLKSRRESKLEIEGEEVAASDPSWLNPDGSPDIEQTLRPKRPSGAKQSRVAKQPQAAKKPSKKRLRNKHQRPARQNRDVPIDGDSHPLLNINQIFEHLTNQAVKIDRGVWKSPDGKFERIGKNTLASLDGQVLRLGTMCSGTEAPILCLDAICECKFGMDCMNWRTPGNMQ